MAAKRGATSDLNHENWNQDEEPEDAGIFQRASDDTIKRRIIKTARRRNPISSVRVTSSQKPFQFVLKMEKFIIANDLVKRIKRFNLTGRTLEFKIKPIPSGEEPVSWIKDAINQSAEPDKKSAFTGFTGFSTTSSPASSAFSFLSNITNQTQTPEANGRNIITEKFEIEKDNLAIAVSSSNKNKSLFANVKETNGKTNNYFSKLKGLNESVANWIKKHVDINPLINLQPIFKDYEKYFKELEKEDPKLLIEPKNFDSRKYEKVSVLSTFVFKAAENIPDSTTGKARLEFDKTNVSKINDLSCGSAASFSPNQNKSSLGVGITTTSNTLSFGSTNISTSNALIPSFSFGSNAGNNAPTSSSSNFKFSDTTPFTFSNVTQPASSIESKKEDEREEDNEPPKVEFTPVVEKDYIFTTKCKVFVKKADGNYGDRGVGNLYLKQIANSDKVQLIVRADTNLGNLLCNFILSKSIPTKRMGKKDIMLVCLPTPDVKPPPLPVLLRVKSPEVADNLLEILEKHKK